jgi:DNA-binding transcriptional ArsR family regulator
MAETTVELIFGAKAGIVWRALNQNGSSNISDLVKSTSMSREEVYGALAWLGREGKITVEQKGRAMIFSLQEAESRLEASEGSTIEDSVHQEKSKPRKGKATKK